MNFIQKISASIACLVCFLAFSAASAQTLPNGTYAKTNFGAVDISCISPALCFGSYQSKTSFLYLSSSLDNNQFTGYWAEPDASQTCPVTHQFSNIRTNAWGSVIFTFDTSANNWTGLWAYCDEQPNREFNGARTQEVTQQNYVSDGNSDYDMSLAERLVGSWLPTEDSGARRNDMYTFNPDSTYVISDGSTNSPPGNWILKNAQLFLDGRQVPLDFMGEYIEFSGDMYERDVFNGEDYEVQNIIGNIEPAGVFVPNEQENSSVPKVGNYVLGYVILGQADSFRPGASAEAGVPVYVEFWNETETVKEDEAGNGYRDDIIAFEATGYEVGPDSLVFHGHHPDWGDMYFSAKFDGNRVAAQTSYELGGGPKPKNADRPVIVGDMLVKGHIFRDVELSLAFLH
jgi:hypothetical protein